MTQTPDRIWINTSYIDSRSTIPVLPCNIGTSEQSLSRSDEAQYLLATPTREAAQDMLDALLEAKRMLLHYGTRDAGGIAQIDAAIAKATGEPT
jgi:hypothetical protein